MSVQAPATLFDQDSVRRAVDTVLTDFLATQTHSTLDRSLPQQAAEELSGFLGAGGKRIRPVPCVAGWQAARGTGTPDPAIRAAASLEMFHSFALIHDDIIDASDTRRGQPTVHRQTSTHAAILIGDLALVFADQLLPGAGLTPAQLDAVLPIANALRADTIYGQYLDISHAGQPSADPGPALTIAQYSIAKYTIEGPLLLGAALTGGGDAIRATLTACGMAVGEAFQLRDDLLGIFGNPTHTGKPSLDDLREGKATVLMALALQNASGPQRRVLHHHVGNPHLNDDDADKIRTVLTDTGARTAVEEMITERRQSALTTLDTVNLPTHVTAVLRSLAISATSRTT
ncbi:polyprenyl synthetase family protein [Streptomyces sp. NBC_01558]|uniref:polyprenyl synthetase family protein n=1 Tax=Streptomyces sp. NBC_01558 TaxID=2975878 RepID=UPI002DDBF49C|nr:polyprenyl synthetase family protein [Streptomyces sp. NBC_01558]WSD74963.1 polyprenyl synthetase family protein [Streptomyces sp. NBC_01558]